MADHWIQKAVSAHPGKMTAAAKREGVSNSAFEQEHKHDSGTKGKEARLALTIKKLKDGAVVDCPHCGGKLQLSEEPEKMCGGGVVRRYGG